MKNEKLDIRPMGLAESPRKKDVIGQSRTFIDDFIQAAESEKIYKSMGINNDKTFLIIGDHGNGKTLAIEALVNEINTEPYNKLINGEKSTYNLCGFQYSTGKFGTAYINEGSKNVQTFFDTGFKYANSGFKTLLIFDEAETLFGKRMAKNSHKEDSKLLNTIMTNMQTLHNTDNMYAVMMSNFPDAFDEASIRAGRIDKHYVFSKPNIKERIIAFQHAQTSINSKAGYSVVRNIDYEELSDLSTGFSYSDIMESVKSAVKLRAKQISRDRTSNIIPAGYIGHKRVKSSVIEHKKSFLKKYINNIGFQL